MYDDGRLPGLEDFETVWTRVSPGAAPCAPGEGDEARLRAHIEAEARAADFYAALARRSRSAARELAAIAADDRAQLRALQAEFYLLTGDSFTPPGSCPLAQGCLSDLRAACLAKRRSAETYRETARRMESPALAALCQRHAEEEARHAETLRALILRAV